MKLKKLMVAALATAITVGSVMPASAAWVESGSNWRYQNEDGSWKSGTWFEESGKKYYLDVNGNAQKGWFKDTDGKWYFFGYNGVMQTGIIKVDDKVYFMNADGSLFVGNMKVGTTEYNFTENGTTNGKPYVLASQTWAGNGNQTNVVKGGGGYSSSRGSVGSVSTPSVDTEETVEESVQSIIDNVGASEFITPSIDGKTITLKVEEGKGDASVEELLGEISSVLTDINENPNVESITWKGFVISDEESILEAASERGLDLSQIKLKNLSGRSYSVKIGVKGGESITYTFSIK